MKSPNTLMVQGTTSDAGKSVLVAALCRILVRHGVQVAPFKPQNMALNSAVTAQGGEIGRAQAVQAEAAKIPPHVDMNPVLLKPNSDIGAQVILLGKSIGNIDAFDYHQYKPKMLGHVLAAHQRLTKQYQAVIVEGAGSPAEINLRDRDIANMGFAEEADCPVIIVADIDKGGVFAHLVGTYDLLSPTEQQRVKGFIINKFRGDISLLQPGIDWLEARLGIPVLATIPYIQNLHIEAEDAIDFSQTLDQKNHIKVTVIVYPRISNHTDFDVLRLHPNVELTFARTPNEAPHSDLIILPGSKNVQADLAWLKQQGWQSVIHQHLRYGGKVLGICGGYQMLGQSISDPHALESAQATQSQGLGLLAMTTELQSEKTLTNVSGICQSSKAPIKGYEIHLGVSLGEALSRPLFTLNGDIAEGAQSDDGQIKGTYLHGILDNQALLESWLSWAGLKQITPFDYPAFRDQQLDYLADEVEKVWPIEQIKGLLKLDSTQ